MDWQDNPITWAYDEAVRLAGLTEDPGETPYDRTWAVEFVTLVADRKGWNEAIADDVIHDVGGLSWSTDLPRALRKAAVVVTAAGQAHPDQLKDWQKVVSGFNQAYHHQTGTHADRVEANRWSTQYTGTVGETVQDIEDGAERAAEVVETGAKLTGKLLPWLVGLLGLGLLL